MKGEKIELTKELADELMKIRGEARGIHFKNDAQFILAKKGKIGLEKVEMELKRVGYPIDYQKVRNLEFYPAGLRPLSLLAAGQVFDWGDKEIREMCAFAAGVSFVVKLYMKFFHSIPAVMEKAAKMWREYYSEGSLVVKDYNEKERYAKIRVEDFETHAIFCRCLEGYLQNVTKMVTKSDKVTCQETECPFIGGKGHEFLIKY